MDSQENYITTKQLLKDLKFFTIHVVIYLPANIVLVLFAFRQSTLFLLVIFWAILLLYHGFLIYFNLNRKKISAFLSMVIPS